jgi:predicted transcriptional regulator
MEEIDLKTLLLLLLLRKERMIGRYRLKEMLDMRQHEGVVRRMLEDLTERQWVRPTRSGCALTEVGEKMVAELLPEKGAVEVKQLDLREVNIGPESAVVQMRNRRITGSILVLRDMAVKAGARGAVILTHKKGELGDLSTYRNLSTRHPEVTRILEKSLRLKEDDIVVVGFADTYPKALEGALAVVFEIAKSETEK